MVFFLQIYFIFFSTWVCFNLIQHLTNRPTNGTEGIVKEVIGPTLADTSNGGHLVTKSEYQNIQNHPSVKLGGSQELLDSVAYLTKLLNTTVHNWKIGVLSGNNTVDYLAVNKTLTQIREGEIQQEKVF